MKRSRFAIVTICVLWMAVASVLATEAATTFAGVIVGVDEAKQTITFETRDKQTWTLPVADSNILMPGKVARGDQVMIEINLSKRITKITKMSEPPRAQSLSESLKSLYDARP